MILSDKTIIKMLDESSLVIKPITKEQIQSASVGIKDKQAQQAQKSLWTADKI